ncbi:LysR family transcriptional regulator [Sporomusa malonica]|uniref:DNA-binding transcriptional regulator, LysR family n=2 Tax=Sporomusa malonica TaxID=112901 RepID=A0A1W2E050_9FIRM|nr:DNA-binding transcriptional regulator, LysR family [Sporomusa malonica]
MYVKQLEAFLTVARLLNFGEAARTLNYSQSTISEQVHGLEAYLGARLFERIGRKVFLTEQGKKLLPFAERMIRDVEELKSLFNDDEVVAGSLTIGAAESLCAFWLPPMLKKYRILYPQVKMAIKVGNCVDFPQWLQQNIIDVAFSLNDESGQQQLRQIELFRGETVFIVAADHELSAKKLLKPQDLAGQTLLLPEGYCGYPMDLKFLLEMEQVKANMIMEFGSLESIKQCVKNGLGVSLLPKIAVAEELKRGELVSLAWSGPDIPIEAHMIFHGDKWVSPPLAALEKLIAAEMANDPDFPRDSK